MRILALLFFLALTAAAEIRTLTLRQAMELALQQNPEVLLARLDRQKARDQSTVARDAFVPKLFAGSGGAYVYGFPNSIDGNAPSIIQAKTVMSIFNRPQSYQIAQANESLRGMEIETGARQDEAAYRVASLFLDAEQSARSLSAAERQAANLARVAELVGVRVGEGRELPIESRRADLAMRRAGARVEALTLDRINAETALGLVLGMGPDGRVQPAAEERGSFATPQSEDAAIETALGNSRELKRLESNLQVKTLEAKGYRAERLPRVNLVAQYNLLARYSFENFFQRFQRHNAEIGASFEIPILVGRSGSAQASQAEAEAAKITIEVGRARARITADLRRAYQDVRRADTVRDVTRADLDLAREQITLDLAQLEEGRIPMAKIEQDRATEEEKWLAYFDAQHAAESARLNVLRLSGTVQASLK